MPILLPDGQVFEEGRSWGISASVDLHKCAPDLVRSSSAIGQFVGQLCELIEVTPYGKCVIVHFGEREEIAGYSMTQLIETSLISGHFVNLTDNIFLDVFSCKYFDPQVVAENATDFFRAESVDLNYQVRK